MEERISNVRAYFDILNNVIWHKDYEDLFKDLKEEEYEDFIRTRIEHIIMQFPNADVYYECPKCRHRIIQDQKKPMFVDALVKYFLEQTLNLSRKKLIEGRRIVVHALHDFALELEKHFQNGYILNDEIRKDKLIEDVG
jgi:DNA-directed RNA polymerase subunit RPC12/RpoP